MKNLFIIGNGFDLAHGLDTSFSGFIVEIFRQAILSGVGGNEFSEFLNCKYKPGFGLGGSGFSPKTGELMQAKSLLEIEKHVWSTDYQINKKGVTIYLLTLNSGIN